MIFTSKNFFRVITLFIGIVLIANPAFAAPDPSLKELLARCAPTVAESTMASIVQVESSGHMYAVADAGPVKLPWSVRKNMVRSHFPETKQEAVELVQSLLDKGHTVSLGLSQINDRNLKRLGLTVEKVFEPCTNLSAGAQILTEFYQRATKEFGAGEKALQAALSAYNSGSWERGVTNGYVSQVYKAAGLVPSLKTSKGGRENRAVPPKQTAAAWWSARAELLRQAMDSDLTAPAELTASLN